MVIVLVVERVHWKKYFFSYFFVADGSLNVSANFWQKKDNFKFVSAHSMHSFQIQSVRARYMQDYRYTKLC